MGAEHTRDDNDEQYGTDENLQARAAIHAYGDGPGFEPLADISWDGVARVVDVGCGPGIWLRHALDAGVPEVVGVDLSSGMLHSARQSLGGRVRVAAGDASAIPLRTACADLALCFWMLYHVPGSARPEAVRELRRITRPGGTVAMVTNGSEHMAALDRLLDDALGACGVRSDGSTWPQACLPGELESLARAVFTDVSVRRERPRLRVTEADAVVRYVWSVRDRIERQYGVTWSTLEPRVRERVDAAFARDGAFIVEKESAVVVAR